MTTKQFTSLDETVHRHVFANGLTMYVLPKQGFHRTYVTLSTPLGSNVTTITTPAGTKTLPAGIAHFLEHKLFDQDGTDVSERFATTGARVNAYTMNNRTTYLFSCTKDLDRNLATLLDFVFHPTFTDAGVAKEIDIITQEINMYQDDANTMIYMGALQNLYHHHPVKTDILGTADSIATITKELLYDVHDVFYHPDNMVLFVTGNIHPDQAIEMVAKHLKDSPASGRHSLVPAPQEPPFVARAHDDKTMDVAMPNAVLGIKLNCTDDVDLMRTELIYSITLDLLFGKSTANHETLLEASLINDSFGIDITIERDYGFVLIGGNTRHPEQLIETMKTMLTKNGLDTDHFRRTKRQIVGSFIQALNSLEYIAHQFTKYHYLDTSLFRILDVAATITAEDVITATACLSDPNTWTSYVIRPKQKDD